MTTTNNDEVFDEAMKFLKEGLKRLAREKSGTSHGRKAKRRFGSEVLCDPDVALTKALEYFFDAVAIPSTNLPGKGAVRSFYITRLMDFEFVSILVGCLPDPEAFERSHNNMEEIARILDGFQEFLMYLTITLEQNVQADLLGDRLVAGLFTIGLRSVFQTPGSPEHNLRYYVWQNNLCMLAWATRHDSRRGQEPHTVRLLEYLRWEVRGRKDVNCPVQKPWMPCRPEELNRSGPRDLSRIVADNWIQCLAGSCREMRYLVRHAKLFQVTFNLFLMVTDGDNEFFVTKRDGVVKKFMRKQLQSDSPAGRDPIYLDLGSPDYASGLHNLCCCTIKQSAQELLEYFIRPSCTSVVFHKFCPKNAETTVIQMKNTNVAHEDFDEGISNMSMAHIVARLTTASGLQFAFDPTAAQFGWVENLAPWERYKKRRIDIEYSSAVCDPLGVPPGLTKYIQMPSTPNLAKGWKDACAAEEIVRIASRVLARDGLGGILDVPEDEFVHCLSEFKKYLQSSIGSSAFLRDLHKPAIA